MRHVINKRTNQCRHRQPLASKPSQLAKQQLDNLSCLSVAHFAFGRADNDFNGGLVHGQGHGGTAIYWSKNLKASSFSNCVGSIIDLRVF